MLANVLYANCVLAYTTETNLSLLYQSVAIR